jgi:serine/threonine protein kinase
MPETSANRVRFGAFELDLDTGELSGNGPTVQLSEKPLRILVALIEQRGKLVTRESLQQRLWPHETVVDFEHGINTAIKLLRRALGDSADAPKYVETVPRRGYRLMVRADWVSSAIHQGSSGADSAPRTPGRSGGMTGKVVSHYRVHDLIGGGGMGVVYRAEDLKLGRIVALKFLSEELGGDSTALERFHREARAISILDHPNICPIYEFGEHKGMPFLAMPLLQGLILRDRLAECACRRKPLPLEELLSIGLDISAGLQAAHEKGIIHRDIKPANVFLTNHGHAKVLDFGVAKVAPALATPSRAAEDPAESLTGNGSDLTSPRSCLGTYPYMSPEQVAGQELDVRTDLFSFGVVLYEMATGSLPSRGGDSAEIVKAVADGKPVRLKLADADIPAELERIVQKALEEDRDLRYQTASEMHADLSRLKRDSAPGSGGKSLACKTIAVLPFVNMSPEKDSSYFADGLTEELMHALTPIRELRVVARTSAFQFRNSSKDIRQIGQVLNAQLILEGSVRLAADQLRITARLASAVDGIQLWSGRYDRKFEQVFQIQDEISSAIAATVQNTLAPADLPLAAPKPAPRAEGEMDLEAMKLYLRGRYFWNQRTAAGFRKAVAYFQEAIRCQPRYSRAHAGLADVNILMMMHNLERPRELMPKARQAAAAAVEIDPASARAYCSLAAVHALFDWNWAAAEVEFQRSIEADPNYATAYHWRALVCEIPQNRLHRALTDIKKAEQLDPLSLPIANDIGFIHFFSRRFEQAESQCKAALEINSNFYRVYILLARICAAQQRYEESLAHLNHAFDAMDGDAFRSQALGTLGFVQGRLGDRAQIAKASEELEALDRRAFASPVDWAILATGGGDLDGAFRHLTEAAREKAGFLVFVGVEPLLDDLRQDPRFAALEQEVLLAGRSRSSYPC